MLRSGRQIRSPEASFAIEPSAPTTAPVMFLLNPYDADLDISNKDDRRLYLDACQGLSGYDFGGEREKIGQFIKLLKVEMADKRLTETISIAIKWRSGVRNPDKVANFLDDDNIKTEEVTKHVDLVWSESDYPPTDTPQFFTDWVSFERLKELRGVCRGIV